jgi:ABC-type transporter Mla subunit MlaD
VLRRLAGFILLIVGLAGIAIAIGGFMVTDQVVDAVGATLDSTLTVTSDSLGTVEDTLSLAQTTIGDVNASLDTVEETADSLAKTLSDTEPMLNQVTQIVSEDAPESIESVQAAIPNVAEVAGVIDDTLITLNNFEIDEEFLGFEFKYDLGIDYEPEEPFDETVTELGESLDGLPEQLRSLEDGLADTSANLSTVSENITMIADDLNTINGRIADVDPLMDEYIGLIGNINTTIEQTQTTVDLQLDSAKMVLKVVMVWLGLMQFAMLYLGWDLMTRKEVEPEATEEAAEANQSEDASE